MDAITEMHQPDFSTCEILVDVALRTFNIPEENREYLKSFFELYQFEHETAMIKFRKEQGVYDLKIAKEAFEDNSDNFMKGYNMMLEDCYGD